MPLSETQRVAVQRIKDLASGVLEESSPTPTPVPQPDPLPPTPVPAPTPSPSPSTGALPDVLGVGVLRDNFSYSDAVFRQKLGIGKMYNDGFNHYLAHIDTAKQYNGHNTLVIDQPANSNLTAELWASFSALLDVWFHWGICVPKGFTTQGIYANQDDSMKIAGIGLASPVNGGCRLQTANGLNQNIVLAADVIPAVFDTTIGPLPTDGVDYHCALHYNGATGVLRYFRAPAGQQLKRLGFVQGSRSGYKVNSAQLGLNFNDTRVAAQKYWWLFMEVIDAKMHPSPLAAWGAV